jgi:hypothetical protein
LKRSTKIVILLTSLLFFEGCQETTSVKNENSIDKNSYIFDNVVDNGEFYSIGDIAYYKDTENQMKMVWKYLTKVQQEEIIKNARSKGYVIDDTWSNTIHIAKWSNNTVYYRFMSNATFAKSNIEEAMTWWKNVSGIKFREISGDKSVHFQVVDGLRSFSPIGAHYNNILINRADINNIGEIAHLIGHTLGIGNEHKRPDRDSYINIHWGNIPNKYEGSFARVRYEAPFISLFWTGSIGHTITPYDWESIMHYPTHVSFDGAPEIHVLSPKAQLPSWVTIGGRDQLSLYDGYTANTFYPGATPADPVITSNQAIGPQGTTQHWNRTLTLTWSKSTLPITVYYDLYIENQNINYLKLYKDLKATSHTITVPEYTSYSWKVVAKTYGSSYTTDKKYFNVFDPNPPASVVPEISISNNPPSPRIYWTAISGATSYEIARSENGTNYSVVKTTSNSEWIDSSQTIGSGRPDKTIYYKVRAYVSGQWHNYSSHQGVGVKNSVEEF